MNLLYFQFGIEKKSELSYDEQDDNDKDDCSIYRMVS